MPLPGVGENYQGEQNQHCDSSKFKLEDVIWRDISGTTVSGNHYAGVFLCSGAAGGCSNITSRGAYSLKVKELCESHQHAG